MRRVLVDRCARAKHGEDIESAAALVSHARRDVPVKVGGKDMLRTVCGSPFDGHAVGYVFSYVGLLSFFTTYLVAL
jgi:hypothetical protein